MISVCHIPKATSHFIANQPIKFLPNMIQVLTTTQMWPIKTGNFACCSITAYSVESRAKCQSPGHSGFHWDLHFTTTSWLNHEILSAMHVKELIQSNHSER